MVPNDAGASTIGEYLLKLGYEAWVQEEGFSGKRPFGNSGWKHEVAQSLVLDEVVAGEVLEDGEVDVFSYDMGVVDELVYDAFLEIKKLILA